MRHSSAAYCDALRVLAECPGYWSSIALSSRKRGMATVVRIIAERDKDGNPVWNRRFRQFASEIGFHPDVCDPGAANQKGTVENGVKFVKGNPRVREGRPPGRTDIPG